MVPGAIDPALFGLDETRLLACLPRSTARACSPPSAAPRSSTDEQALFVDYGELPSAVFERVLPAFGLECDAAERARMEAVTRLDAKNPVLPFSDDSTAKARQASPELREAAERWVRPLYDELLAC